MNPVIVRTAPDNREALAGRCLQALPQWFGRPEANARYIAEAAALPMFAAIDDGAAVGFLTLRDIDRATAEIHLIAVLQTHHRRGIGRLLIDAAIADCTRRGLTKLQVQTLGAAEPDRNYAATRAFYRAVGFIPLREDTWNDGTPRMVLERGLP